jgi:hypothetical protein
MATIKKAQLGSLIKKGMRVIDPAKDAAAARKVVKKIKKTETPFDRKVEKEIAPIRKEIDINKYNNASAKPVVLTAEQKANNARILKEIREGKRKNGGPVKKVVKKAKSGTSLGMKSVKAGFDKNPGVTRADIITAAKGKAKSGGSVKKAQNGYQKNKGYEAIKEKELKTIAKTKKTAKTMKSGGKMTKCKYGCK